MTDDEGELTVEFTEILYGVVAANALYKLEFGLGLANGLLLFALVIILDDWVDYTLGTSMATPGPRQHLVSYVLDVTLLVVWYVLTVVPVSALSWYLGALVAFFFLQGLWDLVLLKRDLRDLVVERPYWHLALGYAGVLGIHATVYRFAPRTLLALIAAIFIVRKGYFWAQWYANASDRSVLSGI